MRVAPINLKILAYTLEIEGFDANHVLRQCGIASGDALQEDGEWVPAALFDRMMAAAIDVTGDASFGLIAGKSLALMRYGALTPVVVSSPSLRHMLDDISRFAPLVVERSEIELVETRRAAQLLVQPVVSHGVGGRFRTDMVATSSMQMLRFVGATSDDIHQVDLPHACPAGCERRYEVAFGARVKFEQARCAIHFNPALLDAPMSSHDPVAYVSARTRVEAVLTAMQAGSDLAETIRQWLLRAFPQQPTVQETAAQVGLTERSLRRQLGILGLTHAELTLECQRLMAERLLADGRLPLKQVADALGFASVSSFHRAFRRWSGLTPSAWRERQGEAPVQQAAR